jgi:opacity protein-like surface antigen
MARLLIPTIALLSLLALPVQAEKAEEADYGRTGLYVGGYGIVGFTTNGDTGQGFGSSNTETDGGLNVRLGWRESPSLAYELEMEWIGNTENTDYGTFVWGANARFYLLDQAIQPYVLMGVNGMTAKALSNRDTDWAFRHGLGVDFYVTNHIAISAEGTFLWGTGRFWKQYHLTAGLGMLYRF